jgi:hypothetical protein
VIEPEEKTEASMRVQLDRPPELLPVLLVAELYQRLGVGATDESLEQLDRERFATMLDVAEMVDTAVPSPNE